MPPAPGAPERSRVGGALEGVLAGPVGRHALLGLGGAVCLTVGGYGAGAKPRTGSFFTWTHLSGLTTGIGQGLSTWLVWAGVLLMVLAWVRLGREALAGRVPTSAARWTVVLWAAPMLLALPLFSRDAYSYVAQGALLRDGFDPYTVGPEANPNPLLQSVSPVWRSTTAPYGPAFLLVARGVTSLTGDHVVLGTLLMRVALLPGLALLVWSLPRIATRLGGDPARALWLGVLNPLVLIHLVAGTHNDLLMLGLMTSGLLLVLDRRHLSGVALIALAAAVKATAVVTLPFVVWIWMGHARRRAAGRGRPLPAAWPRSLPFFGRVVGACVAVFVVVFGVLTLAAGVGLGWVSALSGSSNIVNWLSLPTAVAQLVTGVGSWFTDITLPPVLRVTRVVCSVVLVLLAVVVWLRHRRSRADAVTGIVVALLVIVLLSPAALPWYYSWPLVVGAGLALSRRTLVVVVALSTWLMLVFQPAGDTALYIWPQVLGAVAAGLLAGWSLVREDPLRLRPRLHPFRARGPHGRLGG